MSGNGSKGKREGRRGEEKVEKIDMLKGLGEIIKGMQEVWYVREKDEEEHNSDKKGKRGKWMGCVKCPRWGCSTCIEGKEREKGDHICQVCDQTAILQEGMVREWWFAKTVLTNIKEK